MPVSAAHFDFDNTYARLPDRFFSRIDPTPVPAAALIQLNTELACGLNLDPEFLTTPEGVAILSGNAIAPGSEPIAIAYAGHQFGHFVPRLGDGRANLLGEVIGRNGTRYDIQLKGSGPTPFSRRGDGKAALGPVLREYLLSEAMNSLGVPTTRALAAVLSGERILREGYVPGAIFTRVAASHLRVGTFQYFAAQSDLEALRQLADYAIARHYPEAANSPKPIAAFLAGVITRQANLVAQWLLLGFIHGVMNTDNTSISGETIDYGPCAFMEAYDPEKVFSSIDANGRYAYTSQPNAMHWNLSRLAETLLPLLEQEEGNPDAAMVSAVSALNAFAAQFESTYYTGLRHKIGLFSDTASDHEPDNALVQTLLDRMAANQADFTQTFRQLCNAVADPAQDAVVRSNFTDPTAYDTWATLWRQRLEQQTTPAPARAAAMRQVNPAYIPRNHKVQEVIDAAVLHQDFQPFKSLLAVVTNPYTDQPGNDTYANPARPEQCVSQTFCGT